MYATKCSEIMTVELELCVHSTPAEQVARLMERADIGLIPVVENLEYRKLMGVVTDRDLALRVVGEKRDPARTLVGEVMTRQLVTCAPNDAIRLVLGLMEEYRVHRIPVVNESFEIIGIVSATDIAARLRNPELTARLFASISQSKQHAYLSGGKNA